MNGEWRSGTCAGGAASRGLSASGRAFSTEALRVHGVAHGYAAPTWRAGSGPAYSPDPRGNVYARPGPRVPRRR